jgi:hypothetical protein
MIGGMEITPLPTDAIQVLRSLTPDQVEARLVEIAAEQSALSTILRSLKARERVRSSLQRILAPQGGAT